MPNGARDSTCQVVVGLQSALAVRIWVEAPPPARRDPPNPFRVWPNSQRCAVPRVCLDFSFRFPHVGVLVAEIFSDPSSRVSSRSKSPQSLAVFSEGSTFVRLCRVRMHRMGGSASPGNVALMAKRLALSPGGWLSTVVAPVLATAVGCGEAGPAGAGDPSNAAAAPSGAEQGTGMVTGVESPSGNGAAPGLDDDTLLNNGGSAGVGDASSAGSAPQPELPTIPLPEPDIAFAPTEALAQRLADMIWSGQGVAEVAVLLGAMPSREAVGQAAEKMLRDERAREGVARFVRWWLYFDETDRSAQLESLDASLREEVPALGVHLTLDVDGTFEDLMTAPYTFMNAALAEVYGVDGILGTELRKVDYPAGEPRAGLLSSAGALSYFASLTNPPWPAKRSWMVAEPLFCSVLPRVFMPISPLDEMRSVRQQMLEVSSECGGACHELVNSPGFAFIGFDSDGRWNPRPGAAENETQGWIPAHLIADEPTFDGPLELARLLSDRTETRRCFLLQWAQFAVDRNTPADAFSLTDDQTHSLDVAEHAFVESGLVLSQAIVTVVQTNLFLR